MNKSKQLREQNIEDMVDTVFIDWVNSGSELNGRDYLKKRLREALKTQRKVILEEVMTVLDKAELEHWFDMSDSTENWKTWKKIRNLIRDE